MGNGKNYSKYSFSDILRNRRRSCGYKSCSKLAIALLPPVDAFSERYYYDKSVETLRKKIERWENGQAEPTISEFKQLCDVLECDPEYLWGICPTPRRETKQSMDITGLSENSINFFVRQKETAEELQKHAKNDPDLVYWSQNNWHRGAIRGMDILLSHGNIMELLHNIAELQDFAIKINDSLQEAYTYRPENPLDDPNDEWELKVPRSVWDTYKETVQQQQITELNITHKMSYILRDITTVLNTKKAAESGE